MRFTTKDELIKQAIKDGACYEGIRFAKSCKDLQEIVETIDYNMSWWCIKKGYDQFAEHCDWSKFSGYYLAMILQYNPQYADHCDWSKFCGVDWAFLLRYHPQFVDRCDWSKFDKFNWQYLLMFQPQFEVYRQNSNGV